jgi:FtsP/CotA-like multicopper oxidase with cupredoxin domain
MSGHISRRRFLERGALSLAALGGSALLGACGLSGSTSTTAATARQANPDFAPDLELRLTATSRGASILPGATTTLWVYQAELLKGEPESLAKAPGGELIPIIRARRGQKVRVHFENRLPDATASIVHWHGLHLPPEQDAHPRYAIVPGQSYVYEFTVNDRAGSYWFHPHPDMQTGRQVYNGLAGLFLVSDDEETRAKLPSNAQDIPLVIQDRSFDENNQLVYPEGEAMGGGMEFLMGVLGERVLVNGQLDYALDVATRAYRLRLLNASNTRIYKLAWEDGTPLTVIASDGGLLERPVERPYVMLAPGERVELWVDFGGRRLGEELLLQSLAYSGAEGGDGPQAGDHPMGAMDVMEGTDGGHDMDQGDHGSHTMDGMATMANAAPPLGAPMDILRVRVSEGAQVAHALPTLLSRIERYNPVQAVNAASPRSFTLTQPAMRWEINGRVYQMDSTAADETIRLDDLEVWELVNALNPGDTMHPQGMAHPFHIHGVQFQVLERTVLPELEAGWRSVSAGYVDEGWKDTVLLMPGERVKLLLRFTDFTGTYMVHCHILEHEDMGMMLNLNVVA